MIATINAILWIGAEPVLVDVDEDLCMSINHFKKLKTSKQRFSFLLMEGLVMES